MYRRKSRLLQQNAPFDLINNNFWQNADKHIADAAISGGTCFAAQEYPRRLWIAAGALASPVISVPPTAAAFCKDLV